MDIGEAVLKKETLCNEVEIVKGLAYLVDRVSAGGGYETVVSVRTRCGLS